MLSEEAISSPKHKYILPSIFWQDFMRAKAVVGLNFAIDLVFLTDALPPESSGDNAVSHGTVHSERPVWTEIIVHEKVYLALTKNPTNIVRAQQDLPWLCHLMVWMTMAGTWVGASDYILSWNREGWWAQTYSFYSSALWRAQGVICNPPYAPQ
jgi:hypothetical protein